MEPLWVVVTRYLAVYQPWTELNKGHASSAASLGLKYTNLPPVLIAPRALAGGHYILSLASIVVLVCNGLAVALGGLFDSGPLPISTATTFELPLSPRIETQIYLIGGQSMAQRAGSLYAGTFAKDDEYWLIALTNLTGTPLPPWIAPEFYFLPFEWNTTAVNASGLRSANTWGFGANMTCKLLSADLYGQPSWVAGYNDLVLPVGALNFKIPTANGSEVRCSNSDAEMRAKALLAGRFAGEYLYGLVPTDIDDKAAEDPCGSFLVMGWNRGSVTLEPGKSLDQASRTIDTGTYKDTAILCTQRISSAEFNVVVDSNGFVQRFKRLTPFSYDNSSLFSNSTAIANFKAQLNTLIRKNWALDLGAAHNDQYPHSLPHYYIESLGNRSFCDPSKPPPSFEDAQRGFQRFYSWFAPIVIGQNSKRIFRSTTKDGGRKPQTSGYRISIQDRVSMDPVMFYIATLLLGFSTIASIVVFTARPKKILPRIPDSLAAEIGFFYASEALEDTAGTAYMSSGMRERHLAKLGWEYGYGKFMGKGGKLRSGVERMGPIADFKEAS